MDLLELRLLLAVAETGSVSAAAKETGYPRATLRRRLDELEVRAGVALFERRHEGTVLTPAGQRLADKAGPMIDEARALLRSAAEFDPEARPPLRLALTAGAPPGVMVAGFAAIQSQFPELHFDVSVINTPSELHVDDVDVALHLGVMHDADRWVTRPIMQLRELLLASPEYLERRGRPTSVAELDGHDLFAWKTPDTPPDEWPRLDGGCFSVAPRLIHTDVYLLRRLAAAGQGIALIPDLDEDETMESAVEPVLEDVVGRVVPACVSVPRMLADTPRVRVILEAVELFLSEV